MAGKKKSFDALQTKKQRATEKFSQAAEELAALLWQRDDTGVLKFSDRDRHFVRAYFLIEAIVRGEFEQLTEAQQEELAYLLPKMGIDKRTLPDDARVKVITYFQSLQIHPSLFTELERLGAKLRDVAKDNVHAASLALKKLSDDPSTLAPTLGEAPPENSESATALAQKMGIKFRI